jgi:uncharacterized protein (DUF849 family)
MVQACLNGSRTAADHAAVPRSPAELASAAAAAVAAGAACLHVHVRGPGGSESIADTDVGPALIAIRAACPEVPVGVSTGAWIERDPARRLELVAAWRVLPDYASVNLCEPGAAALAAALQRAGVGIEAGVWTAADVPLLVAAAIRPLRVLLEAMEPELAAAEANLAAIERALDAAGVSAPRLAHGQGATAWPILFAAARRGLETRVGLEDVLVLPDGSSARDNADLVRAALAGERG